LTLPISVNLHKTLEVIISGVEKIFASVNSRADEKTKRAAPTLAMKLAAQAGLNEAFAASLTDTSSSNQFDRIQERLNQLTKNMEDMVALIASIDPQFGSDNTVLISALTRTITVKDDFLANAKKGNLLDPDVRTTLASGMQLQAVKLQEVAAALSAAVTSTRQRPS